MTDKQEMEKVEETMENDNETHTKADEDTEVQTQNIQEEDDEVPELIVDDSEGSEGSVHELLISQSGETKEQEVKPQSEDEVTNVPEEQKVVETVESSHSDLYKFGDDKDEDDKKPWKVEDEMTNAEKQ